MTREILFKAKTNEDSFEWVEGYLGRCEKNFVIEDEDGCGVFADQKTICQYIGLTDKNGNKIWENDIVEIVGESGYFIIEWADTEAKWIMYNKADCCSFDFDDYWSTDTEVIGNIFDNPELIENNDLGE